MDGLILAAGLGTRLRPLTDHLPKALVEVGGQTLLERAARRLADAGVDRLVVNVHHHAEQIERFLAALDLGVDVRISRERDAPLETGGALVHARSHFRAGTPLLIHNVDVVSDIDLAALVAANEASGALATLAVMARASARTVLFDERGLIGHANRAAGTRTTVRVPEGAVLEIPFCGIHAASARLVAAITERGRFSIFAPYLRLALAGERIEPFRVDGASWIDVGRPEDLARARASLA